MQEGRPSTCAILGIDFAGLFALMAVLPWLSFIVLLIAEMVVVLWIIVEIIGPISRNNSHT